MEDTNSKDKYTISEKYCYMLISENFCKPYGIYSELNIVEQEYKKLTNNFVNATIYKVKLNNNIVDTKDVYTLIRSNNIIHY